MDVVEQPSGTPTPSGGDSGEITRLLRAVSHGDRSAFDRLVPLVYGELSVLARSNLRLERDDHTLNTTALVHEAYLRLAEQTRATFVNRHQFFAVASEAMRRILIDYAKRRHAGKRGGGTPDLSLDAAESIAAPSLLDDQHALELIALDDALTRLAALHPQGAAIVQYRFFAGLAHEEIAELLGMSERSVRRSWMTAKAWLRREVGDAVRGESTLLAGA